MEFTLRKASDWDFSEVVKVNSLDDLKELSAKFDNRDLVIDFRESEVTIYDGYLE